MKFPCCRLVFVLSVGVALALRPDVINDELLVITASGPVRGKVELTRTEKTVTAFLGIRYAEPPVGNLRFMPAVPARPWTEVFDASRPPETCFQKTLRIARFVPTFKKMLPATQMSEDCLKLNIWVPRPAPRNGTVLVWLHGGGFTQGSTTVPLHRGGTLAGEENLIVVSLNYRLASLGFLYLDHPDAPGNAGLYDQKVALDWIQNNIAAFGGDPQSITLAGQSAGAASAALHAISGLSDKTFSRLALMSPPIVPWAVLEKNVSLTKGFKLAENTGCLSEDRNVSTILECLRKLEPSELIDNEPTKEYNTMVFKPVVDGKIVPVMPDEGWNQGRFKLTNLLLGSNRDEGTVFLTMTMPYVFQVIREQANPVLSDYDNLLKEFFHDPKVVSIVQYEYSRWTGMTNPKNILRYLEKTINDYFFTCTANQMAKVYTDRGAEVYKYYFVHPAPSSQAPEWFGAFHGAELHYVFGDVLDYRPKLRQEEIDFGHRFMRYLGNFARTGNPNERPDGSVESIFWPRHTSQEKQYLVLAPNSTSVGLKLREKHCMFWDRYFPFITKQLGYTMVNE